MKRGKRWNFLLKKLNKNCGFTSMKHIRYVAAFCAEDTQKGCHVGQFLAFKFIFMQSCHHFLQSKFSNMSSVPMR